MSCPVLPRPVPFCPALSCSGMVLVKLASAVQNAMLPAMLLPYRCHTACHAAAVLPARAACQAMLLPCCYHDACPCCCLPCCLHASPLDDCRGRPPDTAQATGAGYLNRASPLAYRIKFTYCADGVNYCMPEGDSKWVAHAITNRGITGVYRMCIYMPACTLPGVVRERGVGWETPARSNTHRALHEPARHHWCLPKGPVPELMLWCWCRLAPLASWCPPRQRRCCTAAHHKGRNGRHSMASTLAEGVEGFFGITCKYMKRYMPFASDDMKCGHWSAPSDAGLGVAARQAAVQLPACLTAGRPPQRDPQRLPADLPPTTQVANREHVG